MWRLWRHGHLLERSRFHEKRARHRSEASVKTKLTSPEYLRPSSDWSSGLSFLRRLFNDFTHLSLPVSFSCSDYLSPASLTAAFKCPSEFISRLAGRTVRWAGQLRIVPVDEWASCSEHVPQVQLAPRPSSARLPGTARHSSAMDRSAALSARPSTTSSRLKQQTNNNGASCHRHHYIADVPI